MNKEEYLKIVEKNKPKENKLMNTINAFMMGGIIGFLGEGIKLFLVHYAHLTGEMATSWVLIIFIFLASLFTALGFFDKLVGIFKCGLIVPITGFAHSITSAALDYKSDGLITGLGANFFKLSGCVIIYGILSGFVMALIKVMLYV